MATSKPFLTYNQQMDKLINEKGLTISDRESATRLLKEHSYFALICGYKKPFKVADVYKKGTSIEDIYALYLFDENLRYILLKYILIVEKKIKSILAYAFTEKFGEEQRHYLDATKYDYDPTQPKKQADINELITILSRLVKPPFSYHYLEHQNTKHGNIPLWVMVKALPFGSISKMLSLSLKDIQAKVAREFSGIFEYDLVRMLDLLSRFRNVCAHNERAYDYRYNKGAITDTKVHKQILQQNNGLYAVGKSDLYAVVISLKYLIDDESFKSLIAHLQQELDLLFKKTHQIQRPQMYKYMGFPENWTDIVGASI